MPSLFLIKVNYPIYFVNNFIILLDLKINSPEITEGKRFDRVNEYIEENIGKIEETIKNLPDKHTQDWEELNKIFINLL